MKKFLSVVIVLAALTIPAWGAMQEAKHDAKQDVKEAGGKTEHAVKKGGRKVKKTAKQVTHKTAEETTREGAEKVENKTQTQH
jgi:vacuolar-type H+-ATPase subunit H